MSLARSWQFIGGVDSWAYRAYDGMRRQVNARIVRFLTRQLQGTAGGGRESAHRRVRFLEAGSGPAFATSLLRRRINGATAVCMDIDRDALVEARRADPNVLPVVGDLFCMPFADGAFSMVFNSSTVEHVAEPWRAVREMERVAHQDGGVFVGVPYVWGPLWFQPLIQRTRIGVWLGTVFSRRGLNEMMRLAGLRPIAHLRYFFNFFVGAWGVKETT